MRKIVALPGWSLVSASLVLLACTPPAASPDEDLRTEPPPDLSGPTVDLSMMPPEGDPIVAPRGQWTWVDFPDSTCNEGTPTGLGVNWSDSKNLLIYLMGGGACWDYATCYVVNIATKGPIRQQEFEGLVSRGALRGTILDRDLATPFRDWNLVFVPYCTGDVHSGDNDAVYEGAGQRQTWRHRGRANLVAYLRRLKATFPALDRLVLTGSSAGGYGAALNHDLVRRSWPTAAQAHLIDDCGPVLIGDEIPRVLRDAWYTNWRLDRSLGELCPECRDDMSKVVGRLSALYPRDRLSLLAFTQDRVIRTYLGGRSAAEFEAAMNRLASQVLDPLPNVRYFYIRSESHVMLFNPAAHASQGVRLLDWIGQQVGGDAAWRSVRPPS